MGKATGFLEYERSESSASEPLERIRNFNEFHTPLSEDKRRQQAARCMDCGVPFCQNGKMLCGMMSGCPLNNLIPEWNDLLYRGHKEQALSRLLMTNNFPEFTSRVCPALCEKACTCGLNGDPVTVKENENSIIEYGFSQGLIKPNIPQVRSGKKIAVIGSGPSGLSVADTLNHRGHSVTVFERSDRIGGLLMYGIPNMKLEKQVIERRTELMRAEGVTFVTNADVGNNVSADEILSGFDAVVLCCGSSNPRDINAEGRDANGIYFAVDFLRSTTKSLLDSNLSDGKYISAKDKNVVIIGGGDTGNDCVGTSVRHGCKSVVQIEMMPKLPDERAENNPWPEWPRIKKTDYGQEEAIELYGKDPREYLTTVTKIEGDDMGNVKAVHTVEVDWSTGAPVPVKGTEQVRPCELVLIAMGFLGPEQELLKQLTLDVDGRSNILAKEEDHKTSLRGVFAAGDCRRGQSLVVWAIREGRQAADAVDKFLMK